MIYAHIFDDYILQGMLGKLKQKKWWKDNGYTGIYKYDYIMALLEHAYSWSFTIHAVMITGMIILHMKIEVTYIIINLFMNLLIHAFVDDLKANKLKLSLIQDQLIHIIQIILTWLVLIKI